MTYKVIEITHYDTIASFQFDQYASDAQIKEASISMLTPKGRKARMECVQRGGDSTINIDGEDLHFEMRDLDRIIKLMFMKCEQSDGDVLDFELGGSQAIINKIYAAIYRQARQSKTPLKNIYVEWGAGYDLVGREFLQEMSEEQMQEAQRQRIFTHFDPSTGDYVAH